MTTDAIRARIRECEILAIPEALTPTEITAASQAGADLIQVFPRAPLMECEQG